MQIYIDQSGKVEYTSRATVVAYANGKQKALSISAVDKREVQKVFRKVNRPDMFMFRTFGILIAILILPEIKQITSVIIDLEYKGNENLVKDSLMQALRKKSVNFDKDLIHFLPVGKKHPCHTTAIAVFRGERKPEVKVTAKEVLEYVI